jgi:hypothetical protein
MNNFNLNARYISDIERWTTDIKTPAGNTCYVAIGFSKKESEDRARFLIKALELQIELSDLNIAEHEAKHELPCRKK